MKIRAGGFPAWTADSKRVLFHSRIPKNRVLSIGLDALQEEPTIFFANPTSLYPAISADGSRIAFSSHGMLKVSDTKTGHLSRAYHTRRV